MPTQFADGIFPPTLHWGRTYEWNVWSYWAGFRGIARLFEEQAVFDADGFTSAVDTLLSIAAAVVAPQASTFAKVHPPGWLGHADIDYFMQLLFDLEERCVLLGVPYPDWDSTWLMQHINSVAKRHAELRNNLLMRNTWHFETGSTLQKITILDHALRWEECSSDHFALVAGRQQGEHFTAKQFLDVVYPKAALCWGAICGLDATLEQAYALVEPQRTRYSTAQLPDITE